MSMFYNSDSAMHDGSEQARNRLGIGQVRAAFRVEAGFCRYIKTIYSKNLLVDLLLAKIMRVYKLSCYDDDMVT